VFPKHYEIFVRILAISAFSFCLPMMAQERNGWQFDSLRANLKGSEPDAQRVYEVLLKMLDRWNAHDIEGHLGVYWKSPELLVVVDSEQFNGWQQLHDSYLNGYPDRNAMGLYPTQTHPGQVAEAGSRTGPHMVVGLFPEFEAYGGGEHHDGSPKV
jgi:hypothetical protein